MSGPWEDFQSADAKPWEQFKPQPKAKPFGQRLEEGIADIPRQVGMTGRYALEGVGGFADMLASPIRAGLNAIPGVNIAGNSGQALADTLGLPSPRTADERVVGDMARMGFGGMAPIGAAAQAAKAASGTTQAVGRLMASNPGTQVASAVAAGGAGGYTRETGGGEGAQAVASLGAGLAAPFALHKATSMSKSFGDAARRLVTPPAAQQASQQVKVDVTINNALKESGLTLDQLPADVLRSIRADVSKAMHTGGPLSPDAIRRLAEYRAVGATPTMAGVTRDAAIYTQQANLAKLGINSKDPAAQTLGQVANANNHTLIAGLNKLGAGAAEDSIGGAQKIIGALEARNRRAQELIGHRYDRARAADGRAAALDPHAFTNKANDLLDEHMLGGKLPSDVRNLLNKAAEGKMPLTVDVAEQFKTRIGELQRSTTDMAERKALGLVRGALDDTPLIDGQEIGQGAMDAFGKARKLNRSWMQIVEKTPALQAVRDGIEPDKFVQQFIIGAGPKANVMDLAMLKNSIKASPEAMGAVKTQITSFLKSKALNGAADEVGNFSQSGYNQALESIGERKLALFFSPQEVAQMKSIGKVASYEQVQPKGSAVGNSNTGAVLGAQLLDRFGGSALLSKIPLGKLAQEPIQNISVGIQSRHALDPAQALIDRMKQQQAQQGMMFSPAMFMPQPEQ